MGGITCPRRATDRDDNADVDDDDDDDGDGVTRRSDSRAVPVTLPCEHTYCSECIRRSISYSSENSTPKCPLNYCNEAASEKLLKKHGLLEQMMEVCRV